MKKLFTIVALTLAIGLASPLQACAHDGYIFVKNKKTGQSNVYELAYDGWVYRTGNMVLWSGDEGKTWYVVSY